MWRSKSITLVHFKCGLSYAKIVCYTENVTTLTMACQLRALALTILFGCGYFEIYFHSKQK